MKLDMSRAGDKFDSSLSIYQDVFGEIFLELATTRAKRAPFAVTHCGRSDVYVMVIR